MAEVICNKCNHDFNSMHHMGMSGVTTIGAATGAYLGAYFGVDIGVVGVPLGAIIGTIPGAIIGGTLTSLGISKFAKCPSCENIFIV